MLKSESGFNTILNIQFLKLLLLLIQTCESMKLNSTLRYMIGCLKTETIAIGNYLFI